MKHAPRPIIVIDSREQAPLRFSPQAVVLRHGIKSGADYSCLGYESRIGIERKSLDDLVGSLTAGRERFARSLRRLAQRRWRLLLVEAPFTALLAGWYRSRATPTSMLGSICSIMADGIPVVFADDPGAAAQLAERWLTKCWHRAREEDAIACVEWVDEGAVSTAERRAA